MGRNFPSYRSYLQALVSDVEKIKRLVKDKRIADSLDEIVDFLIRESGSISVSQNYIVMQLLLVIAKVLAEVKKDDGGDNT